MGAGGVGEHKGWAVPARVHGLTGHRAHGPTGPWAHGPPPRRAASATGRLRDGPTGPWAHELTGRLRDEAPNQNSAWARTALGGSKPGLGGPNPPWEVQDGPVAQNGLGRPNTDGPKSVIFSAEWRGTKCPVGPGRNATETGIRDRPPSQRAQEKNTPFGHTPHSD